ncbi:hypothetical protein [Clostridium estertheticum]|uniref:hypothetical protein n=1 Tax=Clostridium estertheticum TaxID=238834 RepID=UPI001C0E5CF3|nr:hypothetical protein [Clostridium estertheticum]MBU3186511.1 hypothetical protein [Clostridium estertheticum]
MRVAKNARNLNDNRETEAEVERYKKKKRGLAGMSKIEHMDGTGQSWGLVYYNN